MDTNQSLDELAAVIRGVLVSSELDFAEPEPHAFMANLPGERRLKTSCWLRLGTSALSIEAFVIRKPDENAEQVYRWLLGRNAKMFGVAWSIDETGDVHLTGRWPLSAVTEDSVDRILGSVLEYADSSFNTLLELGFGSSIRKEWEWRESRGESMANLAAFAGYVKRTS